MSTRLVVRCPVCGHVPELPRMTPELLWFRAGASARRGAVMPDGRWAVLAGDLIVSLSDEEWRHYRSWCESAAATQSAMREVAA